MAENLQVEDLPETKGQTAAVVADGDDPIVELKKQLADRDAKVKATLETAEAERRRAEAAEQRVGAATQEVEQYKTQAQTAEQKAVSNAIDAASRESESALHEYEAAMNAADYAAAGKAQAKIAKVAAQLVQFETAKAAIDAQAARQPTQVRVDTQQRQVDPTEVFLGSFSPRTQGWLREHRDLITQDGYGRPGLSNKAMAAHYSAVAEGIAPESDEYFTFMEDKMAPPRREEVEDPPVQQRRAAPVSAPVSRDTPSTNGRTNTRIRLTPEQVEIARISGLTEAQYAENLTALKAEGKIGRTTH
jgi:hypothetical protein